MTRRNRSLKGQVSTWVLYAVLVAVVILLFIFITHGVAQSNGGFLGFFGG